MDSSIDSFSDSLSKIPTGTGADSVELLPRQTTPKSKRVVSFVARVVSFAPPREMNDIYEVPHIRDYSSELIGSLWYNDMDYDRINTSCTKIIRKMSCEKPAIEERMKKNYCPRGLENFTDAGALARRTIRDSAIGAVMDEQARQRKNDVFETDRIADIYAQRCLKCKIDAIITARRDELESTHAVRCKKKLDAFIKNSQSDKLERGPSSYTPSPNKTNAPPPQAYATCQ
jgi:hypothetical protein